MVFRLDKRLPGVDGKGGEVHPAVRARILRALGFMAHLKGGRRIAGQLTEREGQFVIRNGDLWYAGNLASFIDREVYLYRGYDKDQISAFLAACPPGGTILDIGAYAVRIASASPANSTR